MGRGSLGEVLPPDFVSLFVAAASDVTDCSLGWTGPSGAAHEFGTPGPNPVSLREPERLSTAPVVDDLAEVR
jgi:hypothetical protein